MIYDRKRFGLILKVWNCYCIRGNSLLTDEAYIIFYKSNSDAWFLSDLGDFPIYIYHRLHDKLLQYNTT